MSTRNLKPRCDEADCVHNKCGALCELLTDYVGYPCPFFKTLTQFRSDKKKAHDRLVELGRFDLIEKYEFNLERKGW